MGLQASLTVLSKLDIVGLRRRRQRTVVNVDSDGGCSWNGEETFSARASNPNPNPSSGMADTDFVSLGKYNISISCKLDAWFTPC